MQPRAQLAALRPRAVCSDVERRAAVLLHDDLRARGHEAWLETHWVRPQLAPAVALGCATAAAGGLIAIGAPALGLAVAALGALSLLADVAGATGPLRALLPRRASQVVLVAPAGRAVVDLLVAARSDACRAGWPGCPAARWRWRSRRRRAWPGPTACCSEPSSSCPRSC